MVLPVFMPEYWEVTREADSGGRLERNESSGMLPGEENILLGGTWR